MRRDRSDVARDFACNCTTAILLGDNAQESVFTAERDRSELALQLALAEALIADRGWVLAEYDVARGSG